MPIGMNKSGAISTPMDKGNRAHRTGTIGLTWARREAMSEQDLRWKGP
jgi:hypothetical protein